MRTTGGGGVGARIGSWLLFVPLLSLPAACAGHSENPVQQYSTSQLDCLVTLDSYCCASTDDPTCVPTFAAARECSSWPAGTSLEIYPTACEGLTAVRVVGSAYSTFYVYDPTGALYAVGDNATTSDPRSGAISCGAGPSTFVIPTDCADVWLGTAAAVTCEAGTSTAASICH